MASLDSVSLLLRYLLISLDGIFPRITLLVVFRVFCPSIRGLLWFVRTFVIVSYLRVRGLLLVLISSIDPLAV